MVQNMAGDSTRKKLKDGGEKSQKTKGGVIELAMPGRRHNKLVLPGWTMERPVAEDKCGNHHQLTG